MDGFEFDALPVDEPLQVHQAARVVGNDVIGPGFGGHTGTEWLSFLLFWGLNIWIIYRGMDLQKNH